VDACGTCGGHATSKAACSQAGPNPAVIAGATIGATAAAFIAAIALFLLYMRYKNPNWIIQDQLDKMDAGQQHNPLYEASNKDKSNPLYVGK